MVAKLITSILFVFLLASCSGSKDSMSPQTTNPPTSTTTTVPGIAPELQVRTTSGEWFADKGGAGGTDNVDTFKDYQYTIEVAKDNQKVDIALTSADINVQFTLFNPLGQQVGISTLSRSPANSYTVNAGTYRVSVAAQRQAVGKFTLTVTGVNGDPARIQSQYLASNSQTWGPFGGGGKDVTYKNHFYTFEVTEDNMSVDVELESADTEVAFYIFNTLGQQLNTSFFGDRSKYIILKLNKGTYTVMAATAVRGSLGNYNLRIFGKIQNLKRVESQILQSNTQNWGVLGGGGKDVSYKNHFYTFEVTEDNLSVDTELESADTDVALYVYNDLGQPLNTSYFGDRIRYTILKLNKGTYTAMAATAVRSSVGNYSLRVFGKVQNLKRVESQSNTVKGTWANGKAVDTYSVELTPNSSPLDIDLSSSETGCQIDLQNSSGTRISYNPVAANSNFLIGKNLAKATYLIKVYPGTVSGKAGNYTLNIFGRYTNFKKI